MDYLINKRTYLIVKYWVGIIGCLTVVVVFKINLQLIS